MHVSVVDVLYHRKSRLSHQPLPVATLYQDARYLVEVFIFSFHIIYSFFVVVVFGSICLILITGLLVVLKS